MIATPFQVKRYRGDFDGIIDVAPVATDDETEGYYVGFRALQINGLSWTCTDATEDAAVWAADTSKDSEIGSSLRAVSDIVARYCNNLFIADSPDYAKMDDVTYGVDTLTFDDGVFDTLFHVGDSLLIMGSGRNNGYYIASTVAATVLTMTSDFAVAMDDTRAQAVVNISWPEGLREIGARMAEYDVYRRIGSAGLIQESIGSYSSTKESTDLFGTAYPNSVIAGISAYKRPRIATGVPLGFEGYVL